MNIVVGCIVLHKLSGLFYVCENNKQERWMRMNPFYEYVPAESWPPKSYFEKNL